MTTTADNLSAEQVEALKVEAYRAGDYVVAAWCLLLQDRDEELEGAEPGTAFHLVLYEWRRGELPEAFLRELVADTISAAEAQAEKNETE